ncbi:MAG TPA: glycosyltransferase family 4 protein [Armatimonadota bacterium]|nr:glycosyltransferase family 4 protein [Armatimonadota bacterium]
MSKIRVALLAPWMQSGGVETYLLRLARFLEQQQNIELEIVVTQEKGSWFERIAEYGLQARFIDGMHWTSPARHMRRILRWLTDNPYDVILINHDKLTQTILPRLPERTVVIPVIHNDHENIYSIAGMNHDAWNCAVTVSQRLYQVASQRLPENSFCCIPHGVELPDAESLRRRQAFSHPLQLLFVGRLDHDQKGVLLLPDIIRRCHERGMQVHLAIAGIGGDEERLHSACEHDREVSSRIRFYGEIPLTDAYNLMLNAHVLLFPSFFEGFGLTVVEAQGCGCVPVASRLPGTTDTTVKDGITGLLVEPGDVEAMVDAIYTLYNDQDRWQRMSAAAHNHVADHFSIEKMGQAYLDLITDAMAGKYPLPCPRSADHVLDTSLLTPRDYRLIWPRDIERTLRRLLWGRFMHR